MAFRRVGAYGLTALCSAVCLLLMVADNWALTEVAKLTASDAAEGDHFATSVSMSGDRVVVSEGLLLICPPCSMQRSIGSMGMSLHVVGRLRSPRTSSATCSRRLLCGVRRVVTARSPALG